MQASALEFPLDAVEVGVVLGAWGVRGALKVQAHSPDPQALYASRRWFLRPAEGVMAALSIPAWAHPLHIMSVREQGGSIVVSAAGLEGRDDAQALRGCRVFVSRQSFPSAAPGEYYWVDLIDLAVINRSGEPLGRVLGLIETGAHPVLRVADANPAGPRERLIPFVAAYVDEVDLQARCIRVDWCPEWDAA